MANSLVLIFFTCLVRESFSSITKSRRVTELVFVNIYLNFQFILLTEGVMLYLFKDGVA